MTLAFGAPLAFAGLAALAVPLLLHLERRRTPRVLAFAALRWLGRAQPARRAPRLVEPWLLALRLALVAAAVLWCAEPRIEGWTRAPREVLLVAPGVAAPADAAPGREGYWLAPGFPPLSSPLPADAGATASLLREFDATLGPDDRLTVQVPRLLDGLDEAALRLTHAVDWQVREGASPRDPSTGSAPRRLAVRHEADPEPALRFVRAALAAWEQAAPGRVQAEIAPAGTPLPGAVDAVLWFGATPDAAARARADAGALLLSVAGQASGSEGHEPFGTAAPSGRGTWRRAEVEWDPARLPLLYDPAFPRKLHEVLFGAPAPTRVDAAAVAPQQEGRATQPPLPLEEPLAWAIAVLFLLERVLASGARLGRAA